MCMISFSNYKYVNSRGVMMCALWCVAILLQHTLGLRILPPLGNTGSTSTTTIGGGGIRLDNTARTCQHHQAALGSTLFSSRIIQQAYSTRLWSVPPSMDNTQVSSANLLRFGNTMKIANRLPSRNLVFVQNFLQDPSLIVETVYDKSRYHKHGPGVYTIRFASIPIPGIDTITPELTIEFTSENHVINMKSTAWKLTSTKLLKDVKFMNTFNILLTGYLEVDASKSFDGELIHTLGSVSYEVQGEKPLLLKAAPAFILDKTIEFIQSCVEEFVAKRFSMKYLEAFKNYQQTQTALAAASSSSM